MTTEPTGDRRPTRHVSKGAIKLFGAAFTAVFGFAVLAYLSEPVERLLPGTPPKVNWPSAGCR